MGKTTKRISEAKRLLEENGYTVIPPEETEIRTADFEDFWTLYDKKIDKSKCVKVWAKMTPQEKKACMSAVPVYVQSTPQKQYRRNPLTYLNSKSWNDEIYWRDNTAEERRQQRIGEAARIVARYSQEDNGNTK